MTVWRLHVPDPLAAMVRRLHPDLKRKVGTSLATTSQDPHTGKSLRDELEGLRTFRVARFRIIYRILDEERTVDIVAIGPRENIYEETYRLVGRERQE